MTQAELLAETLSARLYDASGPLLVAIDGRCASGKTALASFLAEHLQAPVFHTDDFYLPFALRTPQRLLQPGGHMDMQRLVREVLEPARAGLPVVYRAYHAHTDTWAEAAPVAPHRLYIVEGAYSLLPEAEEFYDYKIFLTHDPAVQRARLVKREGAEKFRLFESRWIPAEEKYFSVCVPRARADAAFDTSDWW